MDSISRHVPFVMLLALAVALARPVPDRGGDIHTNEWRRSANT